MCVGVAHAVLLGLPVDRKSIVGLCIIKKVNRYAKVVSTNKRYIEYSEFLKDVKAGAVLGKNILGVWPLIIWEATTSRTTVSNRPVLSNLCTTYVP